MTENYKSASFITKDGNTNICYRTSLTVAEEALFDGVPVSLGYNASGYPLDVLTNCSSRLNPSDFGEPFCFNIEIDGESICRNMTIENTEKSEENGILHAVVAFVSGVKDIKIYEHTILDGTGMFTRYLEIENCSDAPVKLSRLVLHGGGIEKTKLDNENLLKNERYDNIYSYGCFGNDEWGREGEFAMHTLNPGVTGIECCLNVSRFRHPALFIQNNLTGLMYCVQVGWCAGVRFEMNYCAKELANRTTLSYTAEITGHKPLYVLGAGEKFTTPEVHFAVVHGGIDEAVNEGIKHIRKSVLNAPEADGSKLLVGSGMGPEHDMSVETSKIYAKQLHDMGAELFIIDAGWYCPPDRENEWHSMNGIHEPDKDRYPNGIEEVSDYCRSIGMKFGMWVEPERVGRDSGIMELHPDWFVNDLYGRKVDGLINMANPGAAQWVENELVKIITRFRLDLLRIDYNVSGNEMFAFSDCGSGTEECIALRHFTAVNKMYARLKKQFPDVIFENCAGGGGRTDLGILKGFSHTWVSDNQKMPRSIEITNGMTMVLPPERIDRLFAGMGCHENGELYAHIRNAMLTHMTLNVVSNSSLEANSESIEFAKHSTDFYKKYIRPMLPTALVYHHTPDRKTAEEKGYSALEISAPDRSIGFAAVFTLPCSGSKKITLSPKGVDVGSDYIVYSDNYRAEYKMTGREIISQGICVDISSALSSELIMYKKI